VQRLTKVTGRGAAQATSRRAELRVPPNKSSLRWRAVADASAGAPSHLALRCCIREGCPATTRSGTSRILSICAPGLRCVGPRPCPPASPPHRRLRAPCFAHRERTPPCCTPLAAACIYPSIVGRSAPVVDASFSTVGGCAAAEQHRRPERPSIGSGANRLPPSLRSRIEMRAAYHSGQDRGNQRDC
jgi:hypothetical protein